MSDKIKIILWPVKEQAENPTYISITERIGEVTCTELLILKARQNCIIRQ
jgi:hypothetical protein